MRKCFLLAFLSALLLPAAPEWLLIRSVDGTQIEGTTRAKTIRVTSEGKSRDVRLTEILSLHNASPASSFESQKIKEGLASIQGADRKDRDSAVEEMTAIGIPVMTPLLTTLKDTDQREPRPLYRLFERIMPSQADNFDRKLSLVRLVNGQTLRVQLPGDNLNLVTSDGRNTDLPWSSIRSLAVRQKSARRSSPVHSIRHCLQIDYLDTGLVLTSGSKLATDASGFVRLSWDADGWASDANGLTKPGSPSYKTNLVNGHPFGALVGRIGSAGSLFFLGKHSDKIWAQPGRLSLAINDNGHWQNNVGSFLVTLTATDAYDLGDAQ